MRHGITSPRRSTTAPKPMMNCRRDLLDLSADVPAEEPPAQPRRPRPTGGKTSTKRKGWTLKASYRVAQSMALPIQAPC